jgi:transcriptional regulator with XRE-family HTH domain
MSVESFSSLLRTYRERADMSCNQLARAIGVDPSYISRLERGEREPPRRAVILGVIPALRLEAAEADRLLLSGGYAPADWEARLARLEELESLERGLRRLLGYWDERRAAVTRALEAS